VSDKPINPVLKQVLELGPPLLFFAAYIWIKDRKFEIAGTSYSGFIVAAAAFVPILLVSIAVLWKLTGKLSRMQIVTAVLVVVFGGLTVWFNDESFFKMKTTIVYGLFAAMLGAGLLRGQSYLAWVMSDFLPLEQEGWMKLTRRMTACFAAMAAGNELVWRYLPTDAWVKIETFGFPILLFAFLWSQLVMLEKYFIDEDAEAKDEAKEQAGGRG